MTVVVIPGALGCFLTGLVYALFSNWGFFKHPWIIFKWIVIILAFLSGNFLGSWERAMMKISGQIGITSLNDPKYLYNEKMNLIFGTIQVLVLMITMFISIFKPWKTTKAKKRITERQ